MLMLSFLPTFVVSHRCIGGRPPAQETRLAPQATRATTSPKGLQSPFTSATAELSGDGAAALVARARLLWSASRWAGSLLAAPLGSSFPTLCTQDNFHTT